MAKYDVEVKLVGTDGNAFALMAKVKRALQKAGVSTEEQSNFINEATSGDYNHLLKTCCEWVNVN